MTPTERAHIQNILDDPLNDGIEGPRMKYSQRAQALIDQWKARVGGLLTLRILADVLAEDGDERMASACRDAVRWFEAADGYLVRSRNWKLKSEWTPWFHPTHGISRVTPLQWASLLAGSAWHAIELYADYPPLDVKTPRP